MKTPTKKYIVKVKINNKYKNIKVYAFSKSNATHKTTLWEGVEYSQIQRVKTFI